MSRKRKHAYPLVEVSWADSTANSTWDEVDGHQHQGALRCRTVGYMLRRDREIVVVAQNLALSGYDPKDIHHAGCSMSIPMGCVSRVRILEQ